MSIESPSAEAQGYLNERLSLLGLSLSPEQLQAELQLLDYLLAENKKFNLTAIKGFEEGITKHLVDSLSLLSLNSAQKRPQLLADLGSGGGMPGLALALALPEAQVLLVESTKKKAHFLDQASAQLGMMKRVKVAPERAEVLGQGTQREHMDWVTCRAVGRLPVILELGVPLLKVGGLLFAYKGPKAEEELALAKNAIGLLKVELAEKRELTLPLSEEGRTLLVFRKLERTHKTYPRANGLPANEPLL